MSSMRMPSAPNGGLFKQGLKNYQSEDGWVSRNIEAVNQISAMVRTSIGPSGRNKIIVNHLGKIFLTSDASTILREVDIVHPAVKLVVMAAQQQEAELGDAANLVVVLAGELLTKAEDLIRIGMAPAEIVQGYELAQTYAIKALTAHQTAIEADLHDPKALAKILSSVIASKQYGNEGILADLVGEAVASVMPKNPAAFNVDNVRVVKILGSSLEASYVVKGMVFNTAPEGEIIKARDAKVAVFTSPVDISQTETKGTVLLHSAQEMLDFSKGEETQVEQMVKELVEGSNVKVVIAGAGVGALALHYLNRYGVLVFRVSSKFDLQRLCRVTGASPLPRLGAPTPDELGVIDVVETTEVGGDRVTIFRQSATTTRTSTIVLRGATLNLLDDLERAIDDGVAAVKALTREFAGVPGAGAEEIAIATEVVKEGERTSSTLQHALKHYGQAFEVVPRTLAENAGLDGTAVVAELYSAYAKGKSYGVDVTRESADGTVDVVAAGITDIALAKRSAIELATQAANTILSVDQIIMAKAAGGPTMPKQGGDWDQD